MNNKNERHQFIEDMFLKLDNVPIESIVGSRIPLKKNGRHFMGLCPFHNDTHYGSFLVTPDKGMWKCFTCGEGVGGNGINFVANYDNLDYMEAAFKVALEQNVIDLDDYQKYSDKNVYDEEYVKSLRTRHEKKTTTKAGKKATVKICHDVYCAMKECIALSDDDKNLLLNERKLSEACIVNDYFTFPTSLAAKKKVIKYIQDKYPDYTDDVLITVPGFYREKGKPLTFYSARGIGFLISDGQVVRGIQIRRATKKKNQSRYIWFSSSFAANEPEKYEGGASCGSPRDILYPDKSEKGILCITEGRFKSEVLRAAGNITISVQGVGSWNGIDEDIIAISNKKTVRKIFIFYDSDILGNTAAFGQAIALYELLDMVFPLIQIQIVVWPERFGKGIDDLINMGNQSKLKYCSPTSLADLQEKQVSALLKKYGFTTIAEINRSSKSLAARFKLDLQKEMEKAIFDNLPFS